MTSNVLGVLSTYLSTLMRCFTTKAYLVKSDVAWPTYLIKYLNIWHHMWMLPLDIFWRLRRKSHPSTNVSTNDSTGLQFWLLLCIVIGWKNSKWSKFMSYFRTTVRRKETTWSLPKKFIADNSRTSSFEFLVSSTIMVGNKTHLGFQNITKIKLNLYRAKEYRSRALKGQIKPKANERICFVCFFAFHS